MTEYRSYDELEPMSVNELGITALGSQEAMNKWLNGPVFSLEGQRPIAVLLQHNGVERVRGVLIGLISGFCA